MRIVRRTEVKRVRNPDLNKLLPEPTHTTDVEGNCVLMWSGDVQSVGVETNDDCLSITFEGWTIEIDRCEAAEFLGMTI